MRPAFLFMLSREFRGSMVGHSDERGEGGPDEGRCCQDALFVVGLGGYSCLINLPRRGEVKP